MWRSANPHLPEETCDDLVRQLMDGRRAVRSARNDPDALKEARSRVDAAKRGLGERGPVWWDDGTPDLNRRLVRNTAYRDWWLAKQQGDAC